MRLKDLIEQLQDLYEEIESTYDEKTAEATEVRIATQPQWPFENAIDDAVIVDMADTDEDDDDDGEDESNVTVYIGEGEQLGYLSGHAKRCLGW